MHHPVKTRLWDFFKINIFAYEKWKNGEEKLIILTNLQMLQIFWQSYDIHLIFVEAKWHQWHINQELHILGFDFFLSQIYRNQTTSTTIQVCSGESYAITCKHSAMKWNLVVVNSPFGWQLFEIFDTINFYRRIFPSFELKFLSRRDILHKLYYGNVLMGFWECLQNSWYWEFEIIYTHPHNLKEKEYIGYQDKDSWGLVDPVVIA